MSILFKFNAKLDEEYSSDSWDSDYCPGRDSTNKDNETLRITRNRRYRRKRKSVKSSPSNRKLRKTTTGTYSSVVIDNEHNGTQHHLPPEVLMKIFHYGIDAVGFINFIPRVSQVSKEWNRIASDPLITQRLDLGIKQVLLTRKNQSLLTNLLKRDISQCRQLSLNGQLHIDSSTVEHILSQMPRLRTLDLKDCTIKPGLFKKIPELCPLLQKIDLSSQGGIIRDFTIASVKAFIESLGANLVELRLSNVTSVQLNPSQVLKIIQESCPNLEVLDLGIAGIAVQSGHTFMMSMEDLALACPKLRELYLNGFIVLDKSLTNTPFSGAFTNLEVFSQACHIHYGRDHTVFYSLFYRVPKLKMLNISQSRLLPSLITRWVKEVTQLILQDMKWNEEEEREFVLCINAWSTSLRMLDLSYNKPQGTIIDNALSQFGNTVKPDGHPLEFLNLSNSNVTPKGIINVIGACKNLMKINLTSCRELPRGTKREFRKEEFESLLESLRPYVLENDGHYEHVPFA